MVNASKRVGDGNIIRELAVELRGCTSVLDIGCGWGKYLTQLPDHVTKRVGIEAHKPYADQIRLRSGYKVIVGDARELVKKALPKSIDAVIMIDFIEHLPLDDAIKMIRRAEELAIKRVVIFTPHGEHPQAPGTGQEFSDEEWKWQTHRSTWTADALHELGYAVDIWQFKPWPDGRLKPAVWASKTLTPTPKTA